jgi:hypothetical protein
MNGRVCVGGVCVVVLLLAVAWPSLALGGGGRDGGAERDDHAGASPLPAEEAPLQRRRREQRRFALYLVGGALGVYVLYKIVRR